MKPLKIAQCGAALFAASGASAAGAATTITFGYTAPSTHDITLVGSNAQYHYYDVNDGSTSDIQYFSGSASAGYGSFVSTDSLPTFASAYRNLSGAVSVSNNFKMTSAALLTDVSNDPYLQLAFKSGGQDYVGVASFDQGAGLTSITYAIATPEPDSWALLLSGVGMVGAMLRRRRLEAAVGA